MLEERGVDFERHYYIDDPLGREALTGLVAMVGGDPADMVRAKLGETSAEAVVDHLLENPGDMQRPIGVCDGTAIIARPAELILELLD